MNKVTLILFAILLGSGCATKQVLPAGITQPNYHVRVLPGQLSPNIYVAQTDLTMQIEIHNTSTVDLRLTRIEIGTTGANSIDISAAPRVFDEILEAGQTRAFDMYVTATAMGGSREIPEPVRLRGTATFDVPDDDSIAPFRSVFMTSLGGF